MINTKKRISSFAINILLFINIIALCYIAFSAIKFNYLKFDNVVKLNIINGLFNTVNIILNIYVLIFLKKFIQKNLNIVKMLYITALYLLITGFSFFILNISTQLILTGKINTFFSSIIPLMFIVIGIILRTYSKQGKGE